MSRRALWNPAANGLDAPTPPPAAPSTLPVRSVPAGALAAQGKLARLADLVTEVAKILHELSEVSLADARDSRDRTCVETKSTSTRLLSVRDIAQRLCLSERTVRRLRQRGELPTGIEVAGTIRWREAEIDAWIGERS